MKKVSTKTLMVLTLMVASFAATPMMVVGDNYDFDQAPGITDPEDLMEIFGGFGSMFGGLGYGGQIIGRVFDMLLMQTLTNFSQTEIIPGVYVLSAFSEETFNGTRDFGTGTYEYYLPTHEYNQSLVEDAGEGYAYCEVKKEGLADYELVIGAGVTLLIYDQDKSFITAFQKKKIIDFINKMMKMDSNTMSEKEQMNLIREGIEVLTWFLIHINDIFTGEELFAMNPITWQSMKITPQPGFNLTKTWRVTGSNYQVEGPSDEELTVAVTGSDQMLIDWNNTAKLHKDSYMEWLLRPTDDASLVESYFTAFTFDLIQLWVKNFEIHVDAAAIVDLINGGGSGPTAIADIFRGLDFEFYLFTHHLAGVFLYNDTNKDGRVSSTYRNVTINDVPVTIDGEPVQVPDSSEISHRVMLGTVEDFAFELPHKTGTNKISWGLRLNNPTIIPVPVGIDLESYLGAKTEDLAYIHFGFSFQPKEVAPGILSAPIKLDQFFAPWNNPDSPYSNNDIANLDLAIIYLSTMLHFHLNVATLGEDPDDPTTILDPADDLRRRS